MGRAAVLNKCPETMCILQNNGPSRVQSPEPRAAFKKSQPESVVAWRGWTSGLRLFSKPAPKEDLGYQKRWGKCQEEILECENVVVRKCLGLIKVLATAGSGNCASRHFTLDPTGVVCLPFLFSANLTVKAPD